MMKQILATDFWRQQDPVFSITDPVSTFSRAAPAYRHYPVGGSSHLESVGNNVLRCSWQRDGDTGLWIRGAHLEPERTNLLTYSTDFTTGWSQVNISVTDSAIILPDGVESDYDILHEDDSPATTHGIMRGVGTTLGETYTFSAYYKAINRNVVKLYPKAGKVIAFDLAAGEVQGQAGARDYGMRYIGNGWWFCWYSFVSGGGTHYHRSRACLDDGNWTFDGLDQDSLYVLWPQAEQGEYPTSRIDTGSNPVSRTADSDWEVAGPYPNARQGWMCGKYYITPHTNSAEIPLLTLSDGGGSADRIRLAINTSQQLEVQSAATAGDSGLVVGSNIMTGRSEGHQWYITWRPGELCLAVDGVFGTTDHAVTISDNLDTLQLHASGGIIGDIQMGRKFSRIPWRIQAAA